MAEGRVPDDLKPCPFCGKEPKIFRLDLGTWIVGHFECLDMTVSTLEFREEENAIAAWNTRVGTAEGLLAEANAKIVRLKRHVSDWECETFGVQVQPTGEDCAGLYFERERLDDLLTNRAIIASRVSGGAK